MPSKPWSNARSPLDYLLQHERLRALVGQMEYLPTIPALYRDIFDALNDSETSIDDVGELVGRDIGMTAGLLKLVNSAFFGLSRPLSHPTEVVYHLGLDTVKSLVLAIGAFVQLCSKAACAPRVGQIWTHSVTVSAYARMIARLEGADRKIQDEACVSGLLHDVGKLVLAVNSSAEEHRVLELARQGKVSDREAGWRVFGADHAAVGSATFSACGGCPCRWLKRSRFTTNPASGRLPLSPPLPPSTSPTHWLQGVVDV